MSEIVIIDYGSGNLRSAAKAFERAAQGKHIVTVSNDPAALATATHIVLPGVGAFADCMQGLNAIPSMRDALETQVLTHKKPFLGICVGMQLLFDEGHEHGTHKGLGWLSGQVIKIESRLSGDQVAGGSMTRSPDHLITQPLKVPHMGWNELDIQQQHPLLAGIAPKSHAYFVHSYHAECSDKADVIATTSYGANLTALVAHGNIMGTQFHPEKSQETGLALIANFSKL
jgi:glutamine amidotransferase